MDASAEATGRSFTARSWCPRPAFVLAKGTVADNRNAHPTPHTPVRIGSITKQFTAIDSQLHYLATDGNTPLPYVRRAPRRGDDTSAPAPQRRPGRLPPTRSTRQRPFPNGLVDTFREPLDHPAGPVVVQQLGLPACPVMHRTSPAHLRRLPRPVTSGPLGCRKRLESTIRPYPPVGYEPIGQPAQIL